MSNRFKVKNGLVVEQGGAEITGSLTITSGITGSLLGTSSFANQSLSSSFALTASLATSASWAPPAAAVITIADEGSSQGNATFINFTGAGVTATVFSNTASINIPGGSGNAFPFTGSAQITGSLGVTGSVQATSFTGSLLGTASTASFAPNYVLNSATSSMLAPYALNSSTSSFITTASFNAFTSSYNTGSFSGSFTGSLLGTASYATQALSSSFSSTASFVNPLQQNVTITGSIFVTQSNISTIDYIDFVTTTNPAFLQGRLHWTDDTKTLQIDTDVNNFMIEVGHQNVVRVRNTTGFDLAIGKVVYINGESGNRPTVTTASWDGDSTSAATLGFVAQQINDNQSGYVITNGLLRNINTTAYAPGTPLYLSSSGDYTSTIPITPKHEVRLGKTVTQAVDGVIYVDVMNGYELGELHDVLDTTTSSSYGDLLVKSGSIWISSKQLTGSYILTGSLTATSGFTGDLSGTSSWASNATNALTASFVLNAVSSSFASTASFIQNAQSASYVLQAISASFASTASFAPNYVLSSRITSGTAAPAGGNDGDIYLQFT